jgi:hypothetical protein
MNFDPFEWFYLSFFCLRLKFFLISCEMGNQWNYKTSHLPADEMSQGLLLDRYVMATTVCSFRISNGSQLEQHFLICQPLFCRGAFFICIIYTIIFLICSYFLYFPVFTLPYIQSIFRRITHFHTVNRHFFTGKVEEIGNNFQVSFPICILSIFCHCIIPTVRSDFMSSKTSSELWTVAHNNIRNVHSFETTYRNLHSTILQSETKLLFGRYFSRCCVDFFLKIHLFILVRISQSCPRVNRKSNNRETNRKVLWKYRVFIYLVSMSIWG